MPVTATASAPSNDAEQPAAIDRAVCALTAPFSKMHAAGTLSNFCFDSFEYVTNPPGYMRDEPATDVIAPAINPPVQLSAVAI